MGFLSDLTGASARRDIKRGREAANREITGGEQAGIARYDTGISRLDSYADPAGYEAYLATLGLRGDNARREVQDTYMSDPIQNALMDRITRANTRRYTGIGMGNSGAATQSLTNALLANYGSYQDRLKGTGDTGLQASGAQATLDKGAGDIAFQAGQQRAGVETSAANALAASRSTLMNNILGIGSLAVNALTGYRKPAAGGSTSYARS
ncbi:MAG: hypothetical protein K2X43_01300 [Hyphomonadaceae bacterium]|jgi:hypothetical protein|nr:hypothetical protein [Hyphomonadaceae bacterium]